MQNKETSTFGADSIEPVPARVFTRAATSLLARTGLSVLVLQGVDTLSGNWDRFSMWIYNEDADTILVIAFHFDVAKAYPALQDLCQVCGHTTEYAVFTIRETIDFEQGTNDCPRCQDHLLSSTSLQGRAGPHQS